MQARLNNEQSLQDALEALDRRPTIRVQRSLSGVRIWLGSGVPLTRSASFGGFSLFSVVPLGLGGASLLAPEPHATLIGIALLMLGGVFLMLDLNLLREWLAERWVFWRDGHRGALRFVQLEPRRLSLSWSLEGETCFGPDQLAGVHAVCEQLRFVERSGRRVTAELAVASSELVVELASVLEAWRQIGTAQLQEEGGHFHEAVSALSEIRKVYSE